MSSNSGDGPRAREPGSVASGIARCHCGGVEMRTAFPSRFVAHCYCHSCRVAHASGVVTWIGFKRAQVSVTKGEELICDYVSSPGTRRKFCTRCGTRLAFESEHHHWGDEMHLPLALFVTPVDREPQGNGFAEERPAWAPFREFGHG